MKQFLAILMVLVLAMVTFTSCITINNGTLDMSRKVETKNTQNLIMLDDRCSGKRSGA